MTCGGCRPIPKAVQACRRAVIRWTVSRRSLYLHLQRWRKPEDRGVGDTLQHVAEHFQGDKLAAWIAKWGLDCQCQNERDYWNEKMPYGNS